MFLLIRRKHLPKIERKDYKYIALVGIVGYFLSIGAQLVGTQLAGASVASLVNSLNPIAILFAAAIILKEPLSWQKIAGVLVQPITSVLLGVLILGEAVTVHMVAGGILIVLGIMFCLVNASQNDKKIQSESV